MKPEEILAYLQKAKEQGKLIPDNLYEELKTLLERPELFDAAFAFLEQYPKLFAAAVFPVYHDALVIGYAIGALAHNSPARIDPKTPADERAVQKAVDALFEALNITTRDTD